MNKKRIIVSSIMLFISIIFVVLCAILLPDYVGIQFGSNGYADKTVPKIVGVLVPFLISAFGTALYFFSTDENNNKNYVITIVGYIAAIAILILN